MVIFQHGKCRRCQCFKAVLHAMSCFSPSILLPLTWAHRRRHWRTVLLCGAQTPWGIWTRAWTAEENRHGDLMNKYAYLSGRVDMRVGVPPIPIRISTQRKPKQLAGCHFGGDCRGECSLPSLPRKGAGRIMPAPSASVAVSRRNIRCGLFVSAWFASRAP